MHLIDLIKYLKNPNELEYLYRKYNVNVDSEVLLIYMKDNLEINSDICIFDIEETGDELFFESKGTNFIQLFPVEHAIELIRSDLDLLSEGYSDSIIAERLLEYRIHDA